MKHSQAALLRAAIGQDPSKAAGLVHLCLELAEVMVLSGLLKLSVIETRMKMEAGGVERQALRLGEKLDSNKKYFRNCGHL